MGSKEHQHSFDVNGARLSSPGSSRIRQPRLVRPDRRQLSWAMLDVERLVDDDHPARAIWELSRDSEVGQR